MMLAAVKHILPVTTIRRTYLLPAAGMVLTRLGAKVSAGDVLAEASLPAGHIALDVRRALGLTSSAELAQALTRQQGDRLEKEDVIAETHGLFARILRAPAPATIVYIGGGMVILRTREEKVELRAGMSGTVTEIVAEYGATVEEHGALVQCAWGNGKVDSGLLAVVCQSPGDRITSDQINVDMHGTIVLGGHCDSADVLRACTDLQLRGLIVSSMRAALVEQAQQAPFPVLVAEGFGNLPWNEAAFRLLSTSERRGACASALFAPSEGQRPEIIIPLNAQGPAGPTVAYFAKGQLVRIASAPYAGKIGKIHQIRPTMVALPSGVRAHAAEIQIENNERVWVPLANLEVLETPENLKRGVSYEQY